MAFKVSPLTINQKVIDAAGSLPDKEYFTYEDVDQRTQQIFFMIMRKENGVMSPGWYKTKVERDQFIASSLQHYTRGDFHPAKNYGREIVLRTLDGLLDTVNIARARLCLGDTGDFTIFEWVYNLRLVQLFLQRVDHSNSETSIQARIFSSEELLETFLKEYKLERTKATNIFK